MMYDKNTKINTTQVRKNIPLKKVKTPITQENYVDEAEKSIYELQNKEDKRGKKIEMVTTSKIRNLLSMTADIYNVVINTDEDKLSQDICSRIEYLRVRFMYEAGKEPKVKALLDNTCIIEMLKQINGSKKNYILFSQYMESLVAFHRYYGGKDN